MADRACALVQADVSADADGEAVDVDRAHVATCVDCARFERGVRSLRAALRFDVLNDVPDVAPAVVAAVSGRASSRRARWLSVAAAFVVGVALGAAFVWPMGKGSGVAAATLPARIVAAQGDVASVAADVVVVQSTGTTTGSLRYRAPESLELVLGETSVVVGDGAWTRSSPFGVIAESGVEPFADNAPAPLDLVLPASAFLVESTPILLEDTEMGDDAIGLRVTAAQVDALLDGLRLVGVGLDVHPTDVVDLWLDAEHLVPRRIVVRAAAGPDRDRWAAARGDPSRGGDVVVEVRYDDVRVNDALAVDALAPPTRDAAVDRGFRDEPVTAPVPTWLPPGMEPWRTGMVGDVGVQTWTDGRAWLKVRSTTSWRGTRLFGGVGDAVRRVRIGDGVAYVADGGGIVAVHGDGVDLVVTGSIEASALRRVAAALGVQGEPVPAPWDEAASIPLTETSTGDVLVLPAASGFAAPAARVDDDTVTLTFSGAGERVLTLAARSGDVLRPPMDPDAVGVVVRGTTGRWSGASGDLEWVEGGRVWSLRSTTVGVGELVALADALEAP